MSNAKFCNCVRFQDLDAAQATYDVQKLESNESQARSGELLSELQQKQATVLECQVRVLQQQLVCATVGFGDGLIAKCNK